MNADICRFITAFSDWRLRHPLPEYRPRYVVYRGKKRRFRKKSCSRMMSELDKSMRRTRDVSKARRYVPWDELRAKGDPR